MDIEALEVELRALMLAGLDGDAAAHSALLKALAAHLRAYFRRHLARVGRGLADAEDLMQETLISIHSRRHTYDRSQPLTPWVHAIARYRLIDYLRRTRQSIEDVPIEMAMEIADEGEGCAVDSALDVKSLLSRLSPKARQAIQWTKLEGATATEAAAAAGASPSAVKVSVHRGLRALSMFVRRKHR